MFHLYFRKSISCLLVSFCISVNELVLKCKQGSLVSKRRKADISVVSVFGVFRYIFCLLFLSPRAAKSVNLSGSDMNFFDPSLRELYYICIQAHDIQGFQQFRMILAYLFKKWAFFKNKDFRISLIVHVSKSWANFCPHPS